MTSSADLQVSTIDADLKVGATSQIGLHLDIAHNVGDAE